MNGRVEVHLSREDADLARFIAEGRNVNEGHFGPRTWGGMNSYEAHLQGAMGEVAVARYYGVEPDTVVVPRGGGAETDNIILGYTVEVKTRPFYDEYYLMVAEHTFKGADVYFACCAEVKRGPYVEIVGWATREMILATEPKRWRGHLPPSYIIPESELRRCVARSAL